MDTVDAQWIEAAFGLRFRIHPQSLRPDAEPIDPGVPGASDVAHLLQGDDDPADARDTLAGIQDVMAGRAPRLDSTGSYPVLFQGDGEHYLHLDYSKIVIGSESFEIWSPSPIGRGFVAKGRTADLLRLWELWCSFVTQHYPSHKASEDERGP